MNIPVFDPEHKQEDFYACFRSDDRNKLVIRVADLAAYIKDKQDNNTLYSDYDYGYKAAMDHLLKAINQT